MAIQEIDNEGRELALGQLQDEVETDSLDVGGGSAAGFIRLGLAIRYILDNLGGAGTLAEVETTSLDVSSGSAAGYSRAGLLLRYIIDHLGGGDGGGAGDAFLELFTSFLHAGDSTITYTDLWYLSGLLNIDCGLYTTGGGNFTVFYEHGQKEELEAYMGMEGSCIAYFEGLFIPTAGVYAYAGNPSGWTVAGGYADPPTLIQTTPNHYTMSHSCFSYGGTDFTTYLGIFVSTGSKASNTRAGLLLRWLVDAFGSVASYFPTIPTIETEVESTSLGLGDGNNAANSRVGLLLRWMVDAFGSVASNIEHITADYGSTEKANIDETVEIIHENVSPVNFDLEAVDDTLTTPPPATDTENSVVAIPVVASTVNILRSLWVNVASFGTGTKMTFSLWVNLNGTVTDVIDTDVSVLGIQNLMKLFGMPEVYGDGIWVTVVTDAGSTGVCTGSYYSAEAVTPIM